jgi:hypothetical protein
MKSSQRIVGWGLVALGAVSLFGGAAPFVPVGLEAFLLGGALFVAGAWILAGKELRDTIRRGLRTRRMGSPRHRAPRPSSAAVLTDPLLPVRILKLARLEHGALTVAQVAMELNVPLEQAQAGLDECVRAGNALPDYDIVRGLSLYRFPEFTEPDQRRLPE